jgi:hypothetical protein
LPSRYVTMSMSKLLKVYIMPSKYLKNWIRLTPPDNPSPQG